MVTAIDEAARAERIWSKILRKPVSIVFTTPRIVSKTGTTAAAALEAQTVRIAYNNPVKLIEGESGTAPQVGAVVYGVVGHPSAEDTDIGEGYTFEHEGNRFRISDVIPVPGGLQAICVALG
jgi:hypothetical protein